MSTNNQIPPMKKLALGTIELLYEQYRHHEQPQSKAMVELIHLIAQRAIDYPLPENGYLNDGTLNSDQFRFDQWFKMPHSSLLLHYEIDTDENRDVASRRLILCFDTASDLVPNGFRDALNQTHPDLARYQGIGMVSMLQTAQNDPASCQILPMAGVIAKKTSQEAPKIHMLALFNDKIQQSISQYGEKEFLYDVSADLQFALLNFCSWLPSHR
jgi:hypothetical protein